MYEKLYIFMRESCRFMLLELIDFGCIDADNLLEDFYFIDCSNPEYFLYFYETVKSLYNEIIS